MSEILKDKDGKPNENNSFYEKEDGIYCKLEQCPQCGKDMKVWAVAEKEMGLMCEDCIVIKTIGDYRNESEQENINS
jgi:hypothetical protein